MFDANKKMWEVIKEGGEVLIKRMDKLSVYKEKFAIDMATMDKILNLGEEDFDRLISELSTLDLNWERDLVDEFVDRAKKKGFDVFDWRKEIIDLIEKARKKQNHYQEKFYGIIDDIITKRSDKYVMSGNEKQ